ncbi:MAG: P-loop NTPase [Clostridiales bacterium]|nr:P-loop NTPase [Clostridiales bacterium]
MARKIVLVSGKGGTGKSSVTAGLSYALADMGYRVLAVDCDVGLRSLDIIFNTGSETVFDWGDIIDGSCDPEKALSKTNSVSVLSAPMKFSDGFTKEEVKKMIDLFDRDFDFILSDAPAGINEGFSLACSMAEEALVVSTPDKVCVRSAGAAADLLLSEGIEFENSRLIINRFNRKATEYRRLLNIDDTIDSCGVRLIGIVPEDANITYCFSNGKELPKRSGARGAFSRIARRVAGEKIPLIIK